MAQKLQVTFRGEPLGELESSEVDMDEAQRLEDIAGMTYNEMVEGVGRSSSKATRALVWFLRFRTLKTGDPVPDLWEKFTFGDVDIKVVGEPDPPLAVADGKRAPKASASDGSGTSPS